MAIDVIGEPTAALGLAWLGVFASLWVANPLKGRLPLSLTESAAAISLDKKLLFSQSSLDKATCC